MRNTIGSKCHCWENKFLYIRPFYIATHLEIGLSPLYYNKLFGLL